MASTRCLGGQSFALSSRHAFAKGFAKPLKLTRAATRRGTGNKVVAMAASISAEDVPDMNKRVLLNWILAGTAGVPIVMMAIPYFSFFVPEGTGSAGGAQVAKDALGNDVNVETWKETHLPGDRSLTQGLKGDPTYLVVKDDGTLESYGLNAVCTHLGCVVPWVKAENKFKCPCHGSQYDTTGKVVRGPAPLSLALVHCDVNSDGVVLFSDWKETDFRTNTAPWWA